MPTESHHRDNVRFVRTFVTHLCIDTYVFLSYYKKTLKLTKYNYFLYQSNLKFYLPNKSD